MEIKDNPKLYIMHIDSFGKNLNDWEKKFIADLLDNPPKVYSPKRVETITRIYDERC